MFEKSKTIVEDLIEEIKGKLKEGKTVGFINSEPSKDENDHFNEPDMDKLTILVDISPQLFFDQRCMPLVKIDIINGVAEKLNESQENNFIFYREISTKLEYHHEKTYPSAKEPVEFFRLYIGFYVEKY